MAAFVLLWLLHQKGLFDPLYDWWDDTFGTDEQRIMEMRKFKINKGHHHINGNKHHIQELRHHRQSAHHRRRSNHNDHKHRHSERNSDHYYYLHHVRKDMDKHGHKKNMGVMQHVNDNIGHHKRRKERDTSKLTSHDEERQAKHDKYEEVLLDRHEAKYRRQ